MYTSCLRERLESHLASTTSTASGTTNHRYLIRERLESYPPSNHRQNLGTQICTNQRQGSRSHLGATTSSLFTNAFNIPKVTSSPTKSPIIDHSLWRGHYCYLGINNSILVSRSLCDYTWEIYVYMVLIGKERLGPDIWPEIPQQAESIKSMIRIT